MPDYEKLYMELYNSITTALELLRREDADGAQELLRSAQIVAEEAHLGE